MKNWQINIIIYQRRLKFVRRGTDGFLPPEPFRRRSAHSCAGVRAQRDEAESGNLEGRASAGGRKGGGKMRTLCAGSSGQRRRLRRE